MSDEVGMDDRSGVGESSERRGVVVRRANSNDLDALSPLFDAYRRFYGLPADEAGARSYLAARIRADESVLFLATHDGRPVGFCQLYPTYCSLDLSRIFVLYDLFVDPSARRLGVAHALLAAAEAHGRSAGASRLELSTALDNSTAQALYESTGWMPDTTYRHYELALPHG